MPKSESEPVKVAASKAEISYQKKMAKMNMPREERNRRANQAKISKYVESLREKGMTDKKEIKKAKMKFVKHNCS